MPGVLHTLATRNNHTQQDQPCLSTNVQGSRGLALTARGNEGCAQLEHYPWFPLSLTAGLEILTGRVKKVGCLDSSSYLPSVEPPASTDLAVVFLPIPIVSSTSRTCMQHPGCAPGTGQELRTAAYSNSSSSRNHTGGSIIQLGHQGVIRINGS